MGRGKGDCLSEDVMDAIMERLPAKSAAAAACVCRSWSRSATRLLSAPNFVTAVSFNRNLEAAIDEIMDKILSKPIRPNFAIAFAGQKFNLSRITTLLKKILGSRIPTVACFATGIIGPDAISSDQKEVTWRQPAYETSKAARRRIIDEQHGLAVTIGHFPGLKIEAIPLCNSLVEDELKSFVDDVGVYTSSVSNHANPLAMIVLADPRANIRGILESLEEGLDGDTVIIGGLAAEHEGACVSFNSQDMETSTSKKILKDRKARKGAPVIYDAVALVFAKRKNDDIESARIHFNPAVSAGLSPVGPTYKAISVRVSRDDVERQTVTWLTCKREGMPAELDGQSVLEDLDDQVGGDILSEGLFIGVSKRSKCSVGKDKAMVPFTIHEVHGADEQYLFVEGEGIKTGDVFRFYRTDSETGKSSSNLALEQVREHLRSPFILDRVHPATTVEMVASTSMQCDNKVLGGLLFACNGRGESYFGEPNVESSIFSHNFPDAPITGMFCLGEIGPPSVRSWEAAGGDTNSRLNFYSSMFLVFSYTLKCAE
ncbi:F-box/LRR-repeat protein At5g63520 isoform X1 [Cryptomeria japonica]|uniref:F-box/LRR-repeat protein At5g63520 isoform X1 n=2 Tax=Cryptomeria japonica TaxID=3369 RepID=UPI0027DA044C|nr:F-box/LRR-repeat protein At5g63520 isoform X1 [Cryptomeria japonica]